MFLGFQDYDGFPWHTVSSNIAISRQMAVGQRPSAMEIKEIAERVGLNDSLSKYPSELSGGMRKRLAFARCIASNAKLVILDEPFSSLDSSSRRELQLLTGEVVAATACGVLMCTHDAHEAALVAHRVLVCSGRPLSIRRTVDIQYPAPTEADPAGYEAIEQTAHKLIRELARPP
jgi:ABC-type nitrate/sulfonate/bicarbonate transport system ATPase subunit